MCNTDEWPAWTVPLRVALILSICMGSLLVHFFGGSLGLTALSTTLEWIDDGEKDDPNHTTGEVAFILPKFSGPENPRFSLRIACPEASAFSSLAFLPLLPPPITS